METIKSDQPNMRQNELIRYNRTSDGAISEFLDTDSTSIVLLLIPV